MEPSVTDFFISLKLSFFVFLFNLIGFFKTEIFYGMIFVNPTATAVVHLRFDLHFQHIHGNDDRFPVGRADF